MKARKKSLKSQQYQPWQLNPDSIKTKQVQLWTQSGVMLTAELTRTEAQEMVRKGIAFVITDQAIGYRE